MTLLDILHIPQLLFWSTSKKLQYPAIQINDRVYVGYFAITCDTFNQMKQVIHSFEGNVSKIKIKINLPIRLHLMLCNDFEKDILHKRLTCFL